MQINPKEAYKLYINALKKVKSLNKNKVIIFYLKNKLDDKLKLLSNAFPKSTMHAIAIKTCSNHEVLKHIVNKGYCLEAASIEEVKLAKKAGITNDKIIFDSPVKTKEEIMFCHNKLSGIYLNANSIIELERYPKNFNGKIGLRINPTLETDAPELLNLSNQNSKFGVPIEKYAEIIDACTKNVMVQGLHIHIGSRINNYQVNLEAINKIYQLANDINKERKKNSIDNKITFIDIGGGIDFSDDNSVYDFTKQINKIKGITENYKLITEYGTFIHRECSFLVSDIEYVIENNKEQASLVYIHTGANLFLRKVYSNIPVSYPYSIFYKNAANSNRKKKKYIISGHLCFEGDILYKNIELEEINERDKFVIYNIGANTLSMWSEHCSISKPKFLFL